MPYADNRAWSDAITATGTSRLYVLGTKRVHLHATYGEQKWRYIKNDTAATAFAAGHLISQQAAASGDRYDGILNATDQASRMRLIGVAQHAIAAQSYGWVLVKGAGLYLADTGDVAANVPLNAGADDGSFDDDAGAIDATIAASQCAWSYSAAVAGATGIAMFDLPDY